MLFVKIFQFYGTFRRNKCIRFADHIDRFILQFGASTVLCSPSTVGDCNKPAKEPSESANDGQARV